MQRRPLEVWNLQVGLTTTLHDWVDGQADLQARLLRTIGDPDARFGEDNLRLLRAIQPWNMVEVFLIGILVALVKLGGMAEIVPGLAIWSFAVLILVLAGTSVSMDFGAVWRRLPVAAS